MILSKILFTDLSINKLKWNGATAIYYDERLPAFGMRVGKHRKVFTIVQGKERKVTTIGYYPELSLQDARKKARIALLGEPSTPQSYPVAVESFLEAVKGRLSPDTTRRYRFYLQSFGFTSLDLTKADITQKLKVFDGKPSSQNHAYAVLRCFLNWAMDQEYIDRHPLIRGRAPNKTKSRSRVLTDDELRKVWRTTEDNAYGRILRLLILTGQRRIEVRNLKPEDVADGFITFHTKRDKINVLPITPLVQENLTLPFQFNNWSDAKRRFDEDCGVDWVHHDARRTLATKLAGMGVMPVVVERILGHAIPGVAGIYNRHSYISEAKAALILYEDHIRMLAKG